MALKLGSRLKKAHKIHQDYGTITMVIAVLQKIQKEQMKRKASSGSSKAAKLKTVMLVKPEDVEAANWVTHPYKPAKRKVSAPFTVNWVMSPPRGGGGHQNIFRFIHHLEQQGHKCRVYLYSTTDHVTVRELQEGMKKSYPDTEAARTMKWLKGPMEEADAVFATGWETAYPVFNDPGKARKFYFVQDFEPYFYSVGSEYVLAENTYKFNFYGITAGHFLSTKLKKDYGMECEGYDFGADPGLYSVTNTGKRKEVFFYARPVTTRRGFELGIMALDIFHKRMPDYTITLAGWDVSEYDIPFPYKNLKALSLKELNAVYNECAAGLVVSLTNMSLMPLELLAAGTIPVVTDGPNNRLVSDNPFIEYAEASPDALAEALVKTVTRKDLPAHAIEASKSVEQAGWDKSKAAFLRILERELNG